MRFLAPSALSKAKYIQRFAIGGNPYAIRIFLGDVPDQDAPLLFEETPTQVGLVYNFSGPITSRGVGAEGCANCETQQAEGALNSGQVILTDYLVENITKRRQQRGLTLQSLTCDEVVDYLKTNLHWRITDVSTCLSCTFVVSLGRK